MLWHVMQTLYQGGLSDFYVAAGYRQDVIKDWVMRLPHTSGDVRVDLRNGTQETLTAGPDPWTITVVDTGLDTQTGGRIRQMRPYIGEEPFLLTYGDGVGQVDIRQLIQQHRSTDFLVTITAVAPPARFGSLALQGHRVTSFAEKSPATESLINGGYMVIEPEVFSYLEGDGTVFESDVLPALAEEGKLGAFIHSGFWMAMDTLRDKRALDALWESGERPWIWTG